MKHFRTLIVTVITALFLCTGFTWEGKLNPNKIVSWDVLKEEKTQMDGIPITVTLHKNPNSNSKFSNIKGFYLKDVLIAYVYYEDGVPNEFKFDGDKGKYIQHELTFKEMKSCVDCHDYNKDNKTGKKI